MCKLFESNLKIDFELYSENLFSITIIVNIIEMIKHSNFPYIFLLVHLLVTDIQIQYHIILDFVMSI